MIDDFDLRVGAASRTGSREKFSSQTELRAWRKIPRGLWCKTVAGLPILKGIKFNIMERSLMKLSFVVGTAIVSLVLWSDNGKLENSQICH